MNLQSTTDCSSKRNFSPEVVDHTGLAEEGEHKGAWPPVALPDQVAARCLGLAQPLLCNGSVQLPMVPSKIREQRSALRTN